MSSNDTEKEQKYSEFLPVHSKAAYFFIGGGRGEILADMRKALAEDVSIIVLTGDEGSGKTRMCEMIAEDAPVGRIPIFFAETVESFEDVVRIVGREVGIRAEMLASAKASDLLHEMKLVLKTCDIRLILLFDQAERIFLATLERIRKMVDQLNEQSVVVQVLFSGQNLLLSNLRQLRIVNFREAVEKKYLLEPLSLTETSAYMQDVLLHHSRQVTESAFPKDIVTKIYAKASGNIGKTKKLAEESLKNLDKNASFWVLFENIQEKKESKPFAVFKNWVSRWERVSWKWPSLRQLFQARARSFSWDWLPRLSMPRLSINWKRLSPLRLLQWLREREWSSILVWLPKISFSRLTARTLKIAGTVICCSAILLLLWPGKKPDSLVTQEKTATGSVKSPLALEKKDTVIVEKEEKAENADVLEQNQTATVEESLSTVQQRGEEQPNITPESGEKKENIAVSARVDGKNTVDSSSHTIEGQEADTETRIPSTTASKPHPVTESQASMQKKVVSTVVRPDYPGKLIGLKTEPVNRADISQQVREIAENVQSEKDRIDRLFAEAKPGKDLKPKPAGGGRVDSEAIKETAPQTKHEAASVEKIVVNKKKVVVQQARLEAPKKIKPSKNEKTTTVDILPQKAKNDTADLVYKKRLAAGEQWTKQKKNNRYTVQLLSLNSANAEEKIKEMLAQESYKESADKLTIVKKNNSPNNIVVFYGDYATMTDARNARNSIPSALRQHNPYAISVDGALRKINGD